MLSENRMHKILSLPILITTIILSAAHITLTANAFAAPSAPLASEHWIEAPEATQMADDSISAGINHVSSRGKNTTGVSKDSLLVFAAAGLSYQHDAVADGAVQVRVYIDEPDKASKDLYVSGYVKGDTVDIVQARLGKWFLNKFAVVSFDQQGDFGVQVRIAARADADGMDLHNLRFYAFDRQENTYNRFQAEYSIDDKDYIHFSTTHAGDIIISSGPLLKKAQAGGLGDGTPAQAARHVLQNPGTGGDGSASPARGNTQNTSIAVSPDINAAAVPSGGGLNVMLLAAILAAVLLISAIMWAVIPRKSDPLISVEEYREKR